MQQSDLSARGAIRSRTVKRPARAPVWLFDLDNTLHHASHAIFGQINRAMTAYIMQALALDEAQANRLRVEYWHRYGATLLGLMRHHGIAAQEFLAAAHAFDDLPSLIRAERGIARLLSRLPGRKILLTNAPTQYAERVMRHLRLHGQFGRHVAIEQMQVHGRLRPKPDRLMLRRLLARERIAPHRAVLVEDTLLHLKRYRQLGIRTVWITGWLSTPAQSAGGAMPRVMRGRPDYVDGKWSSIARLLRQGGFNR